MYLLSKNSASPLPAETKINMGEGREEVGEERMIDWCFKFACEV